MGGIVGVLPPFSVAALDIGTIQSPVLVHFLPSITNLPLCVTVTPIMSNITRHPALHSVTTDTSEYADIPGKICPVRAALGRFGRSNSLVWVDVSLVPSGMVTVIGSFVGLTPVAAESMQRK